MLDYALRRRFAFITVEPKFKSEGFRQLLATNKNMKFNKLTREIVALNEQISRDEMLGPGFMIGHSYFCMKNDVTDEILKNIVNYEILPLLEEYWYDAPEKVTKWREKFERILASTN